MYVCQMSVIYIRKEHFRIFIRIRYSKIIYKIQVKFTIAYPDENPKMHYSNVNHWCGMHACKMQEVTLQIISYSCILHACIFHYWLLNQINLYLCLFTINLKKIFNFNLRKMYAACSQIIIEWPYTSSAFRGLISPLDPIKMWNFGDHVINCRPSLE